MIVTEFGVEPPPAIGTGNTEASQCSASPNCSNKPMVHGNHGMCAKHYKRSLRDRPGWTSGWIPADEVKAHITKLRAAGMTAVQIAHLAGMNADAIYRFDKRGRVRITTAEAILAIRSTIKATHSTARVPITGTARRMQALVAMGYTQKFIADSLGLSRESTDYIIHQRKNLVRADTAENMAELFRSLELVPVIDSRIKRKMLSISSKHGWLPPFVWDEDTIDDPDAQPSLGEAGDWFDEYQDLADMGLSLTSIAARLDITRSGLEKRLRKRAA